MNINDISTRQKYILTKSENDTYTKGSLVYVTRIDKSDNTIKIGLVKNKKIDTIWVKASQLKKTTDYVDPVKAILEKTLSPEDFKIVSNAKGFDDLSLDYEALLGLVVDKITVEDITKLAVESSLEQPKSQCNLDTDIKTAPHLTVDDVEVGSILIPINNTNSHSYKIGEEVEVVKLEPDEGTVIARRPNGDTGNHLDPCDCIFGSCASTTNKNITRQLMSEDCKNILSRFNHASNLSLDQAYINTAFAKIAQPQHIIEAIDAVKSAEVTAD